MNSDSYLQVAKAVQGGEHTTAHFPPTQPKIIVCAGVSQMTAHGQAMNVEDRLGQ
jgi:hypothetical protein